ncbi:MAG: hypothetical protein ABI699_17615 [Caldimonas sp.]
MDVQMPVMSGNEAALELRNAWGPQALPIVASRPPRWCRNASWRWPPA